MYNTVMSHHAHDIAIQRALAALTGRRLPIRLSSQRVATPLVTETAAAVEPRSTARDGSVRPVAADEGVDGRSA